MATQAAVTEQLAGTVWERRIQISLGKEQALVAETATQLRGVDGDARFSEEGREQQRQAVLGRYSQAIAGIDETCTKTLDEQEREAEATLARPLSVLTNEALSGQGRLIDLHARSMTPSQLVEQMQKVLEHGEPAAAAAWCEILPATLAAREAEESDPGRAVATMAARHQAETLAEAYRDQMAPLRPKARETLAAVALWRQKVATHRMDRMGRSRLHPAFASVPNHDIETAFGRMGVVA